MVFLLKLLVNGGVVLTPTAHTSPFYPRERRGRGTAKEEVVYTAGLKKRAKKVRYVPLLYNAGTVLKIEVCMSG